MTHEAERAVVLLARGAYGDTGAIAELAQDMNAAGEAPVVVATLDGAGTPLRATLDSLVADGCERVLVIPLLAPAERSLGRWAERVAARWLTLNPGIELAFAPSSGGLEGLRAAVSAALAAAPRALEPHSAPPNDASWSTLPSHSAHVFVCRGPRCSEAGAGAVASSLGAALDDCGLGDDRVLVAHTACLYPCNLGPTVVVYPEGVWYGAVDAGVAERIVREHLVAGQPVEDHRIEPGGRRLRPTGPHPLRARADEPGGR